ncbi:MAG: multidrug ABC transporter permease [Bacteroidetes bacterium]|nr:MAG: multidrug ABC transporter permease [Bacteroidota bacterium]
MSRFLGFARKEFQHIFRDSRTLIMLFGLPVVMIVLFGYVVSNEISEVQIGIWDRSHDAVTQEACRKLLSSGYFSLAGMVSDEEGVHALFESGQARLVVVFDRDFEEKLRTGEGVAIRVISDGSDANSAQLAQSYLSGVFQSWFSSLDPNLQIPLELKWHVRMLYNEELKGVYMFVPGLMALILMLISALMTSVTIAREKEYGTMELLLASPLKPWEIILGKVAPYVLLSFVNALTIVLLGFLVFDVPVVGSLFLLLAECLLYIILALSLGVLISTVSGTQQMAMVLSLLGLMLPTMLLSGFIFPIDNMPELLQWLSTVMPARWFIVIVKNIMLKGTDFMDVWKETLILTGMSVFFILAAARRFKTRLE